MKSLKSPRSLFLAALLGLSASPALAVSTTISFLGGNSATDGTNGNTRIFTGGSLSVTASAQSSSTGGDPWSASYLGWYSSGLGVTNNWESGSYPSHTVDNLNGYDRVVFDFGSSVVLDSVGLAAFGDTDITVYYYTGSVWTNLESNAGGSSDRVADVNSAAVAASKWAIGTGIPSGNNDDFKIKNLTVITPTPPPTSVPETGSTLLMLGAGTGLLLLAKRRHAAAC
jgi:hypothetical protein